MTTSAERARFAQERADDIAHRKPMVALIYRVIANVLAYEARDEDDK